jgi:hypothetical protein
MWVVFMLFENAQERRRASRFSGLIKSRYHAINFDRQPKHVEVIGSRRNGKIYRENEERAENEKNNKRLRLPSIPPKLTYNRLNQTIDHIPASLQS